MVDHDACTSSDHVCESHHSLSWTRCALEDSQQWQPEKRPVRSSWLSFETVVMALSLDAAGVGGGAALNLAIPSMAASSFAVAGTSWKGEKKLQASHAVIGRLEGHRRLHSHSSDSSQSSHASHTGGHTTSTAAEEQAGECAGDFSIESTLWADSAGCYLDLGSSVYEYVGAEGTYMIAPIALYNTADSPSVWVAGTVAAGAGVDDATTIDPHCHSEGDITVHGHPADVELWLCDIDNTNTVYTEVTAEQFSGDCGCATSAATSAATPAPVAESRDLSTRAPVTIEDEAPTAAPATAAADTPTPTAAPATAGDDDEGESSVTTSETPNGLCGEIMSLSVVTTVETLDEVNGCYEETGHEYHEEGGHFFSITGSHLKGQHALFPGYFDPQSQDPRWFLGFLAIEASDTIIHCVSAQPPSSGHPSTADWYCDDGTGEFVLMDEEDFDILCECDATIATTSDSESESAAATVTPSMAPEHDGASHAPSTAAPIHSEDGHEHGGSSADAPVDDHTGSEHTTTTSAGGDHSHTTSSAGEDHDDHTTTSAGEDHGSHATTSAEGDDHDGHTTSAEEGDDHDGTGHSGAETPAPTTVARGIAGPPDTPTPVAGSADAAVESTEVNAGHRGALSGVLGRATAAAMSGAAALAVLAGGAVVRGI